MAEPAGPFVRLRRQPGALAGLALLGLVLLPALAAPWLPLADPALTAPARRMLPALTGGHWLGTDQLGRDLLARLLWGARASLLVAVLATLVAALTGALIGLLAGFFGRLADVLLMRGIDVLMAFPYLLLALAIVAALGPGLGHAMLAIAVANVPFFARAVRGAVLEIRHQDYIAAARLGGHRGPAIIVAEVLPNLLPTLLLLMTTTLGWMVLETAGLSFLGLGAQPPDADLGSMLGEGREFLTTYPRVAILPGLLILLLVTGINLFGDSLRDLLDPRSPDRIPDQTQDRRLDRHPRPCPAAQCARPAEAVSGASAAPGLASEAPSAAALLQVQDLVLSLTGQSVPLVEGVSFTLERGERVGMVGESGSGKTLTALALLHLQPASMRLDGRRWFAGQELGGLSAAALRDLRGRRIAYIPQDPGAALDPLFRIGVQLAATIRAHPAPADAPPVRVRAARLLAQVGLGDDTQLVRRFPHALSGGQCQRVAIAMALAHDPELLIADEATTALDVRVQAGILDLLGDLSGDGRRALLCVSHDLAVIARLCQRVLVMYAGRVVEDGPLAQVLHTPAHPYTAALLACSPELGRPDKPLPVIPGQPPTAAEARPGAVAGGCRFAPRCRHTQPDCRTDEPALIEVAPGHRVRCRYPL